MTKKFLLALILTVSAFAATAETVVDLGTTRINSQSTTATLSAKSDFQLNKVEPKFKIDYIYQSQNNITIKDRLDFLSAVEKPVSRRLYLQGALRYEHDNLRQHQEKHVTTLGLGIKVIDTSSFAVNYEIAPGYQFYEPRNTAMIRNSVTFYYEFSSGITVSNSITAENTSNSSYLHNVAEVSTEISSNLDLVFHHVYRKEDVTDNITGVKLRIKF